MNREDFIKEVTEIIAEVYDMIESNQSELERYKQLYNDELNHSANLQRLVDRLGAQLDKQTFRREVDKYFKHKDNNITQFSEISAGLNNYFSNFFNDLVGNRNG